MNRSATRIVIEDQCDFLNLQLQELAAEAGINPGTLRKLMDEGNTTLETFTKVASALSLFPSDLMVMIEECRAGSYIREAS